MEVATKADVKRLEQLMRQNMEEMKALLLSRPSENEWMSLADWGKRLKYRNPSSVHAHVKKYPSIYVMGDTLDYKKGTLHVKWEKCEKALLALPPRHAGRPKKQTA